MPRRPRTIRPTTYLLAAALASSASAADGGVDTIVDFDGGARGWSINGWDVISDPGGNPGAHINLNIVDTFGISLRNETDAAFLGDYGAKGPVRLGADFSVRWILFGPTQVSRDLVLELRDYDDPPAGYPYVSVWFNLGPLPTAGSGWQTFEVEIPDPRATVLPPGWGGTGAEDPVTFEPELPADRTFADVIDGVDEIQWTTFVPGFFYGFTAFNISADNVTIECLGNPCDGDLDGDGNVGFTDLNAVLAAWGPCPGCPEDSDDDGNVGFADLNLLLSGWGACP